MSEVLLKRGNVLVLVNPGALHEEPFEMEPDTEYNFKVYTTFDEKDINPHDWSFTLWTDVEPVEVHHIDFPDHEGFRV